MGLFRREKGKYEDIPDEKLDWNQRFQKKYESDAPFYVDSGGYYSRDAREGIDGHLFQILGMRNIDDLFQLKAPRFYAIYHSIDEKLSNLGKYIYENLPNNNQYQQLKGRNDELQIKCKEQKELIDKLMMQNEKLQNQLLEKSNEQCSSPFSRFSR